MTHIIGANVLATLPAAEVVRGKSFGLGDRYTDQIGKEWVFCQLASTAANDGEVFFFDTSYQATLLSTANDTGGLLVGIAHATGVSTDFIWLQVKGPSTIRVLASAVAGARLNTTATAGALDDDGAVGSFKVEGAYLTAANGGAPAATAGVLNYPIVIAPAL